MTFIYSLKLLSIRRITICLRLVICLIIMNRFVDSLSSIFLIIPKLSPLTTSQSRKYFPFSFQLPSLSPKLDLLESVNDSSTVEEFIEIGTRVVTDIDDTIKSSGGVKLFGIPLGGIDVSKIIQVSNSRLRNISLLCRFNMKEEYSILVSFNSPLN